MAQGEEKRKAAEGEVISVGIDPGLDGAVAVIDCPLQNWREGQVELHPVPFIIKAKGKSRRLYDEQGMAQLIRDIESLPGDVFVTLEKAQAMPGQGVHSMFTFGEGFGLWKGILCGLQVSHQVIHPRTWQRIVCRDVPGDTKARAILTAQRYFPKVDLRATERSRKPHTGRADALCMAIFGILDRGLGT